MNILINLLFIFLVCKLIYLYVKREFYNVEIVSILLLIMLNMNVLLYVFFNQEYVQRQIQTVANEPTVQAPVYQSIARSRSRTRPRPVPNSDVRNREPEEYERVPTFANFTNSGQRTNADGKPSNDAQEDIGVLSVRRVLIVVLL